VYERPQTPFVEDFLGQVIRFRGTIVDRSWKGGLVELAGIGARVQAELEDDALQPGHRVLVAIRPEDLELGRSGESRRENTLTCAVERVLYLGSESEILVRAGDESFTLRAPRAKAAEVGQRLDLHLPPELLRVWSDPGSADAPPASIPASAVTAPIGGAATGPR
jgi:ABC-type Fe3+/spermidine/putrescine transport system ATPase subunit